MTEGTVTLKVRNADNSAWYQFGLKGATGPIGVTGPEGDPGDQGPQGATGPAGPTGPSGSIGESGPTGPTGPGGVTGPQGEIGESGVQGSTGPSGVTGPQGEIGESGVQGPTGVSGVTGPQGEIGESGVQGPTGPSGVTGPQGAVGESGATGTTGPGGVQGVTGVQGDQGATGVQGVQGEQGVTGPQGVQGPTGATGVQGVQGVTGVQGIEGPTGATGVQGPQGITGVEGPQGPTGITGVQGAQGPTGPGIATLDEDFDDLNTADIDGQGTYDYFDAWVNDSGAGCDAEVVVESGADKILRLTDDHAVQLAKAHLPVKTGSWIITAVIEFYARTSSNSKMSQMQVIQGSTLRVGFRFKDTGQMALVTSGGETDIGAYSADTWYKVRMHFDFLARAVVMLVDDAFEIRATLPTGDFCDLFRFWTRGSDSGGYTFDIDNLKIFNLTI